MRVALLASAVGVGLSGGCRSGERAAGNESILVQELERVAVEYPAFDGCSGAALNAAQVGRALMQADVIILGEQHDDAVAHDLQREITSFCLSAAPAPPRAALSLEMLERDEQAVLDDYLQGIVDAKTLARLTHSENWGGEGKWFESYQPIIDAARDYGAQVIAANAPRRYVRLARFEGYDRLRALPRQRRSLFALPKRESSKEYRARFFEVMSHDHDSGDESGAAEIDAAQEQRIDAALRAQRIWDATMADSIAKAVRRLGGPRKIVHLVGQFHSDFEGGLVQELRARLPRGKKILVVSFQRDQGDSLREEDRGRADIIIYTGKPPEAEPEPEPVPEPASNGTADERG